MHLSVIIPAYKDEKHIKDTIESIYNYLKNKNMGKGFGVREGMFKGTGDYRLFTDADNATTINHIERMMPYFDQGYSVVIGSIAVPGHTVSAGSEPIWRRLFGKMGNLYIQILAVPGIHDTQRGFKILTAKAAVDIFSRSIVNRWEFDVELLVLAKKLGYKIKEVPVDWKNDPNTGSHPSLFAYFNFLFGVLKIRSNLIAGVYKKTQIDQRVAAVEERDQHVT